MFVSDEDLMMKCRKGDMSAFELLVRRYQNPLINYIHRSVNDYHRAEDLSQETFLRVFKSASRYEPTASFKSWLYTIATNLCRNEVRNRSRRNTYYLEDLVEEGRRCLSYRYDARYSLYAGCSVRKKGTATNYT